MVGVQLTALLAQASSAPAQVIPVQVIIFTAAAERRSQLWAVKCRFLRWPPSQLVALRPGLASVDPATRCSTMP